MSPLTSVEVIDLEELARRWAVSPAWIKRRLLKSHPDRIPRVKLGHHVRFEWGGKELVEWWQKHKTQ